MFLSIQQFLNDTISGTKLWANLQELCQQKGEMTFLRSVVVEIIQNGTDNHQVESLKQTNI